MSLRTLFKPSYIANHVFSGMGPSPLGEFPTRETLHSATPCRGMHGMALIQGQWF